MSGRRTGVAGAGSANRTVLAVVAAGLLVGGVGVYYYMGIYRPREIRGKEAVATDDWERRWSVARSCLLGDRPAAAGGVDAVALGEILDGAKDGCVKVFGDLGRPGQDSSGERGIEDAWHALESAAVRVANAYAVRQADDSSTSAEVRRRNLGAAIDVVEAARATLRERVGRPPSPPPEPRFAIAAPAAAESPPLAFAGAPISDGEITLDLGAETIWISQSDPDRAIVVAAGPTYFATIAERAVRAGAGASWGLWVELDDAGVPTLRADALDDAGEPVLGADDRVGIVRRGAAGAGFSILGAIGKGARRAALYRVWGDDSNASLQLAESSDSGATWRGRRLLTSGEEVDVRFDPFGPRFEVVATDETTPGSQRWLRYDAEAIGRPPRWLTVPGVYVGQRCVAGTTAMWHAERAPDGVFGSAQNSLVIDQPGAATRTLPLPYADALLDCDGKGRALLRRDSSRRALALSLCDPVGCAALPEVPLAEDGGTAALLDAKLGPVTVATAGSLAVIQHGAADAPPTVVRIPDKRTLLGVLSWNGAITAVLRATDGPPTLTTIDLLRP